MLLPLQIPCLSSALSLYKPKPAEIEEERNSNFGRSFKGGLQTDFGTLWGTLWGPFGGRFGDPLGDALGDALGEPRRGALEGMPKWNLGERGRGQALGRALEGSLWGPHIARTLGKAHCDNQSGLDVDFVFVFFLDPTITGGAC